MKIKKTIAFVMCVLLLFGAVCSCNKAEEASTESVEETTDEGAEQVYRNYESFVIVRARETDEDTVKLCAELLELFASKEIDVAEDRAEKVEISEDENKLYILLGETTLPLSQTNQQRVENGGASFLAEGNCLSVCASDSRVLWMAVEQMARSCVKGGKFNLLKKYLDTKIDYSSLSRDGWKLKMPCYVGGELDEKIYSCGYGFVFNEGDLSYMQAVNQTDAQAFEAWKDSLFEYGYREVFSNSIEGHQYVSYEDAFGTLYYAYYLSDLGKVRIVCDSESTPLDEFCYTVESGSNHPEFYAFKYTHGHSGDCFLIHASDDSWIVLDGGYSSAGDPDDCLGEQLYEFMSKRSAMPDGKLVISAWYLSHTHGDHETGFGSLLRHHAKDIVVQRVIHNATDPELHNLTGKINGLANERQNNLFNNIAKMVKSNYPDVKILKAHTGMKIQIADISFTMLFTHEDLLEQWHAGVVEGLCNFNFTSNVCMVEMDGMRILEMADNFRPDLTIAKLYSMETTLDCDIYKVGHHYIDRAAGAMKFHEDFHKACNFQYALITSTSFYTNAVLNDHQYLQELGEEIFTVIRENEVIGFRSNGSTVERRYYTE